MIRLICFCFALCVGAVAANVSDSAAATSQAIESHAYLLGSWSCTFTVGAQGGYYRTTWSLVLGDRWLKQTIDQPAQPRAEPFEAEYLVGYDEAKNSWIRFGAMTTGQYFVIRMTDTGDGWGWNYVRIAGDGRTRPTQFDATFRRMSDQSYAIDGPTYPDRSGSLVTEHHQCRKLG